VSMVGREVLASPSLSLEMTSSSESDHQPSESSNARPTVGQIQILALDEAFLSDETLFGRPEVSPVMLYLMRDLKGLCELIVVRTEGQKTRVGEVESKIEAARVKLVRLCEIWGYEEEVVELKAWKCSGLRVLSLEELRRFCGEVSV
jgi:hypothetical protein